MNWASIPANIAGGEHNIGLYDMSSNLVNNKMINQSSIINNQCPPGTLLALEIHQIVGFLKGSICPFCKNPNIIFRSWRKDHWCGGCGEVFVEKDGKVYHLGNQENLD